MRKGSELIGRPVVAYDSGELIHVVKELLFDLQRHVLVGLVVSQRRGLSQRRRMLPLARVQALGPDAVIVASREVVIPLERAPEMEHALEQSGRAKRARLMTADGCSLGWLHDFYFDEESGLIEGYEVRTADGHHSFLPAAHPLRLGKDILFVLLPAGQWRREEELRPIGEHMEWEADDVERDNRAPLIFERAAGARSGSDLHRTVPIPLERAAGEQEASGPFSTGKLVHWDVIAPDGTLIIRQGEQATEAVLQRAKHHDALDELYRAIGGIAMHARESRRQPLLDDARGLRVRWLVRASRGLIVAAPGQVVTQQVIDRARLYGKEQALLQAVGLLALEEKPLDFDEQLDRSAQQARAGAERLWARIKAWFHSLQESSTHQVEEQRIRRALGRPVTRVIFDREDRVILNTGEIITNQAVQHARQAGVLDVLFNSVYTREPELSVAEVRAAQPAPVAGVESQVPEARLPEQTREQGRSAERRPPELRSGP